MLHDAGDWFGCYGVPGLKTPAIDALAADGVRCGAMFAPEPICSPSRASLITGLAPQRHGVRGISGGVDAWPLRRGEPLARRLGAMSYRCGLFGLQNEHTVTDELGFDHVDTGSPDGVPRPGPGEAVADAAARWLEEHVRGGSSQPVYMQVGLHEAHTPYDFGEARPDDPASVHVPPYVVDDDAARRHIAGLQGAIRVADRAVGRLLAAIDRLGLTDQTLVHFVVDHGPELPRAKWTLYDAGLRVASIWRCPAAGVTGGRVDDRMRTPMDAFATVMDLVTDGRFDASALDGRSFASDLAGRGVTPGREHLVASFTLGGGRCVRTRTHKLIRTFLPQFRTPFPGRVGDAGPNHGRPRVELYDLAADPLESTNLADAPAQAGLRRELSGLLWRELERLADPILRGHVPTPTWHETMAEFAADRSD